MILPAGSDAEAAFSAYLKEEKNDFYPLNSMVEEVVVTAKRTRRGRPHKDEQPVTCRVYRVRLQIGEMEQETYLEAKRMAQCFVLICNIDSDFGAYDL